MKKFKVYAIATGSWLLGEYTAKNEIEAKKLADEDPEAEGYATLCHQCSEKLEINEYYSTQAEEIE